MEDGNLHLKEETVNLYNELEEERQRSQKISVENFQLKQVNEELLNRINQL